MRSIVLTIITNSERNLFYFQLKDKSYYIKEFRNTYAIFGGSVNKGEKEINAIKRELFEELKNNAAKLIVNKIEFIFKCKLILKHEPHKGELEKVTLFESILPKKDLVKISMLPIKEGEKGVLIKRSKINKIKFNGVKEIIDEYLKLKIN
tara:strand:+ start:1039 stop:1488 length:450 start_codon:yes stop_codon:yes gene_type:complete